MRKSFMIKLILFFISILYLSIILPTSLSCSHQRTRVRSIHNKLKKVIHNEMIRIPNNVDNKEKLKQIWYRGGHRNKIGGIISKKDFLTKQDLNDLKFYITAEKKLLSQKIKEISETVNQHLLNQLFEALKFKKTEEEIEKMYKEIEISEVELLDRENKTYDTIINKINQVTNINA